MFQGNGDIFATRSRPPSRFDSFRNESVGCFFWGGEEENNVALPVLIRRGLVKLDAVTDLFGRQKHLNGSLSMIILNESFKDSKTRPTSLFVQRVVGNDSQYDNFFNEFDECHISSCFKIKNYHLRMTA